MSQTADTSGSAELTSLADQIDELSTKLIIDGVDTMSAADFQRFSQAAIEQGRPHVAAAAKAIADRVAPPAKFATPELVRIMSSGLVDLRNLLDSPEPAAGTPIPAATGTEAPGPKAPPQETNSLAADEGLIHEFITESGEHLDTIEGQMLILEKDNTATETLNAVFRAFHTIKGLSGFLEFTAIQSLAHEVETLLDLARTGKLAVTPFVVDVVLESTDIVKQELTAIEHRLAGRTPPPSNVNDALLQKIRNTAKGEAAASAAAATPAPAALAPAAKAMKGKAAKADATPKTTSKAAPKAEAAPVAAVVQPKADATPAKAVVQPEPVASTPPPAPVAEEPALPSAAASAPAESAPAAQPAASAQPAKQTGEPAKSSDNASVRIDTGKLDQLMDMVGEMVIAQTLIGHSPALASVKDARLLRDLTQLARITADVQKITTGMRMVPIGMQFQKTARLVRDLSRRAGKQIVLETTGEDTELDKTIAEELSDPLLHMVRNSIDHGIEPPDERIALGKDPTARIRIAAYHQSGQIVIAISDDGRGLNREKILAKAQQNGLIQHGAQLSDNEIFLLIFEAGFSTAEKITDISGRGVGMDVVRKHVQKLRGRIDIQSKAGQGTTFFLKLPLTLAIIEGLVVIVGDQRYIVPIFSVKEMFRPTAAMISTVQASGELAMVRGSLLPIVRLHRRFGMEPRTTDFTEGTLIVCESEGKQFCLFVDDLVGKQEVVIKSLGQSFKHIVGIAGCAILGDGRVGLILDIDGIYKGRS